MVQQLAPDNLGSGQQGHNRMLDVHPPHHPANSWRDFFVHIATIVIGLLIAVGLEQTVEAVHHRKQVREFEAQMHEVLGNDRLFTANDIESFRAGRAWLVDLQLAIITRRQGKAAPQPALDDPRAAFPLTLPNLAPYEAAKQNGVVALLDTHRLRLFNRIDLQHDLLRKDALAFLDSLLPLTALRMRNDLEPDKFLSSRPLRAADLGKLSSIELAEYQALVANTLAHGDQVVGRLKLFDALAAGILEGVTDEAELVSKARAKVTAEDTGGTHTSP